MTLWDKRLELARRQLIMMANTRNVPDMLIAEHARLFLKAYYRGTWGMLYAIARSEFKALWRQHGWLKWEWFRMKVLRLPPGSALSIAQRVEDEDDEVNKLLDDLNKQ